MAVLDKYRLYNYLKYSHKKIKGTDISPIKVQKGLYFLFAFWGGLIMDGKSNQNEISEIINDLDSHLFNSNFEAWAYGPVDYGIYNDFKTNKNFNEEDAILFIDELDEFTKDYIISTTNRIFNSGDFGLVDLSHQDECWKKHFNRNIHPCHNPIGGEEIINEYAKG